MTVGTERFEYAPQSVLPPGETLKEHLELLSISQADLARRTGLSTKHVNQIIQGAAVLSTETALLLERAVGLPADLWNSLEARWRTHQQRQQEEETLHSQLPWLDNFPLRELVTRGVLPNKAKSVDNLRRLLVFLGVASPEVGQNVWDVYKVAFRRSTTKVPDDYATSVWLRLCELAARDIPCQPYRRDVLIELIPTLRALTLHAPDTWLTELPALCARAGVAVVFEPGMPKTHLSGATRWLTPDKVMIALSDRFKRIDQFWFAFFHEIGHVLLHGKRLTFLDENPGSHSGTSTEEDEANKFAADTLIPQHLAADYQRLKAKPKPFRNIDAFAAHAQIAPGIVVGRLQREGSLKWTEGHIYLTTIDFQIHRATP